MRKLIQCVSVGNKNVSPIETINAIKSAGFDGVFLQWYNNSEWQVSQSEQFELCKSLDLEIKFFHLGYKNINDIWEVGESGDALVPYYINDLNACKKLGINLVVMHLTSKTQAPAPSLVGINRLQEIANHAQNLGIKIAFENTKIPGYLEYTFEHIKNSNIGICFDIGHSHCHFDDKFNFEIFKDKILAVHLHDNDKSYDQHLLPFDGTIDWNYYIQKLKDANYQGDIILESHYDKDYLDMPLDEFYELSYQKAQKLAELFSLENTMTKPADKEELLRVLDENGNFGGGQKINRSIVHQNDLFHNEVALWIIDKENKQVLLQRRSPNKKSNPNKLALCAGHVVEDETIEEALKKEAFEEIGIDISKYHVHKLGVIKRVEPNNHNFSHHFCILERIPIETMTIQQEELSEVLYLDYETVKNMAKTESNEIVFKWTEAYQAVFKKLDEIILE